MTKAYTPGPYQSELDRAATKFLKSKGLKWNGAKPPKPHSRARNSKLKGKR